MIPLTPALITKVTNAKMTTWIPHHLGLSQSTPAALWRVTTVGRGKKRDMAAHISITVDDVDSVLRAVGEFGGRVRTGTHIGVAVFARIQMDR
jgi:hypothetical protein